MSLMLIAHMFVSFTSRYTVYIIHQVIINQTNFLKDFVKLYYLPTYLATCVTMTTKSICIVPHSV